MTRPRLLDLFCGAGGAAKGYQRAGFYVVGVDIEPQPHYCGDEFVQADAMTFPLDGFDVIHASPPCQAYGSFDALNRSLGRGPSKHPKLIGPVREQLMAAGLLYVLENTPLAPLRNHIRLCGSSFGLGVRRHRLFEISPMPLGVPPCSHHGRRFVGVYGNHPASGLVHKDGYVRQPRAASIDEARAAMDIDWMSWDEIREAIPPAYTEWIGTQLMAHLTERTVA